MGHSPDSQKTAGKKATASGRGGKKIRASKAAVAQTTTTDESTEDDADPGKKNTSAAVAKGSNALVGSSSANRRSGSEGEMSAGDDSDKMERILAEYTIMKGQHA